MCFVQYPRHLVLLVLVSIVLGAISVGVPGVLDPFAITTFAASGGLHAVALAASLREHVSLPRRTVFVIAAAVATCIAPNIGMLATQAAGIYSLGASIMIAAASGAILYALLIKLLLSRGLRRRTLPITAVLCAACSYAVLRLPTSVVNLPFLLIVSWWFAFSAGMWLSQLKLRVPALRVLTGFRSNRIG